MMDAMSEDKLVTVTERALAKAQAVRDEEPDSGKLALFLEVTEPNGLEYGYDLYFDDDTAVHEGDVVYLPPRVMHRMINESDDWVEHLIISCPVSGTE